MAGLDQTHYIGVQMSPAASASPVKPLHLVLWAVLKAAIWATLGALWLRSGHVPWRAAIIGEMIAYGPIPIYLAWVGYKVWTTRRREARGNAA